MVPPQVFFVESEPPMVTASERKQLRDLVVFENEEFVLLNKPAGWPVHAGSGHDVGIIEVAQSWPDGSKLQLAHRLDKDTSGCLLLAKSRLALTQFQSALKQHQVGKIYLAILDGVIDGPQSVSLSLDT